jgi:hypothetical protein
MLPAPLTARRSVAAAQLPLVVPVGEPYESRFLIERPVASGGMGTVYQAVDAETARPVALKILDDLEADEVRRFEREAVLLRELVHPGIVKYLGHGVDRDEQRYLVMEWVEGPTLAQFLAEPGLSPAEAVRVATRIAQALAYVHGRGIVHRDVKPANLILRGGDVDGVTLLDLGVARRIAEPRTLTRTGLSVGTPGYMAPEQARGERDLDGRADLFALGCVLYECLAGTPAFTGEHATALRAKILTTEPPPLRERNPGVPEALDALVSAMLAKDPADRPGDADEVMAALGRLADVPAVPRRRAWGVHSATEAMPLRPRLRSSDRRVLVMVVDPGGARGSDAIVGDAGRHGVCLERMADGKLIAMISGRRHRPLERAADVRRCATEILVGAGPDARVVLAASADGDHPGDVIDRAMRLLDAAETESLFGRVPRECGVQVDEAAARLLKGEGAPR